MKKVVFFLAVSLALLLILGRTTGQNGDEKKSDKKHANGGLVVDTRIDNMGYWMKAAKMGLVPYNPPVPFRPAEYTGSEIHAFSVTDADSPDVPVTSATNVTETENSISVNPTNDNHVLNSNNSTSWSGGSVGTLYGANYFYSTNGGSTWGGSSGGAGGSNSGDPVALFNLQGRQYVGYINNNSGQSVSYSTNGTTWTAVVVANAPSGWSSLLDKNHLWVDNSSTSSYEGNVYDAWTTFGGTYDTEIGLSRSTNDGVSWSSVQYISTAVNAGSHNQGVNISTGPNGEVYAVWAIYDSWPSDECALGFAKSTNGGSSFGSATRIISNIKGIRTSETNKNMRVNSFPSMTVDISNGSYRGYIYVVWTNIGTPGTNTGTNRSVYVIRSTNGGTSWSTPVKVNQGSFVNGKEAYFPWITCDPVTGVLSAVFYDDRNTSSSSCEVFAANSYDGGVTWEDFKVSDVSFTPSPVSGLASSYMGDYLAISARGGKVYPCWTDNRSGYMTYVSPYSTNTLAAPTNLVANVNQGNGQVSLTWSFSGGGTFQYFNIYRNNVVIGTSTTTSYTDNLPTYGVYEYDVTAVHTTGESVPATASVQWGFPNIAVSPASFTVTMPPDNTQTKTLTINNTGQLALSYSASTQISTDNGSKAYCTASGGCDEYISRVQIGTIDNSSACDGYHDYTSLSTSVMVGTGYAVTVTNGNPYSSDQCGIWVDWNHNEVFTDAGETMTVSGTPGNGPYTATITPPTGAVSGNTRMRIRIMYTGTLSSCGTSTYGEVEDYTLNVVGWLTVSPTSGTIPAGSSQNLSVVFNSTGLALGTYYGNVILTSNDPDQPTLQVPCTLNVSNTSNLQFNLRAYLQGPFNGTDMNRTLNLNGYLPTVQPYGISPWNYSGTETTVPTNLNMVDWVLVELRETTGGPSTATSSTMIARQAGVLLNNGYIVGTDGVSLLQFSLNISNNLYVVIWHRNHLAIMSSTALVKVGNTYTYDFSTGYDKTYGGLNGCKQLATGVYGMFGGDGNADGMVTNPDKVDIWQVQCGTQGYLAGDFTMNCLVDNIDKNDIWRVNAGYGTQVP
jgi:hypothetical protein